MFVFLDIDGVLNTSKQWKVMFSLDDKCIRLFAEAVNACSPKIILTSSWRKGFIARNNSNNASYIKILEEKLSAYNLSILGKTNIIGPGMRDVEIHQFIKEHSQIMEEGYIIIDDDASEFSDAKKCKNLYLANHKVGFSETDKKNIRKIIASAR